MSPKNNTKTKPMSPKNNLVNLAREGLRRCRQPPPLKKSDKKKKKKKKKKKLKLNESEANKTLYICYHEEYHPVDQNRISYVVRSIKVSDLLSSSSDSVLPLTQVASMTGDDLPGYMGCGVLGSQILFAGGKTPALCFGPPPTWQKDVYVFETKQPAGDIRKMDAKLLQAKHFPALFEVGGKLHALSYKLVSDPPSFEVFDPEMGTWSALPEPPFFRRGGGLLSYAITGTKMFVSQDKYPVFCFDLAHPDRKWRLVPSMCQRGPFPFVNRALVLDLPGDHNKKLMFAYAYQRPWCLGVYIMFLDENQESITKIADLELPVLPEEFVSPQGCYILHIGGHKACLAAPGMNLRKGHDYQVAGGSHKTRGVVIPFQFQVDVTKIDKDAKNCFTLQFMPTRIIEFYTTPSTYTGPGVDGCFVL